MFSSTRGAEGANYGGKSLGATERLARRRSPWTPTRAGLCCSSPPPSATCEPPRAPWLTPPRRTNGVPSCAPSTTAARSLGRSGWTPVPTSQQRPRLESTRAQTLALCCASRATQRALTSMLVRLTRSQMVAVQAAKADSPPSADTKVRAARLRSGAHTRARCRLGPSSPSMRRPTRRPLWRAGISPRSRGATVSSRRGTGIHAKAGGSSSSGANAAQPIANAGGSAPSPPSLSTRPEKSVSPATLARRRSAGPSSRSGRCARAASTGALSTCLLAAARQHAALTSAVAARCAVRLPS
mmetsp:Transcript_30147/g.82418  ORF Transcript_30147/g.82418 Transcript_30147/m.82418 type:complete len:298 (+) Transcript_30147:1336-2229(+)